MSSPIANRDLAATAADFNEKGGASALQRGSASPPDGAARRGAGRPRKAAAAKVRVFRGSTTRPARSRAWRRSIDTGQLEYSGEGCSGMDSRRKDRVHLRRCGEASRSGEIPTDMRQECSSRRITSANRAAIDKALPAEAFFPDRRADLYRNRPSIRRSRRAHPHASLRKQRSAVPGPRCQMLHMYSPNAAGRTKCS